MFLEPLILDRAAMHIAHLTVRGCLPTSRYLTALMDVARSVTFLTDHFRLL